MEKTKVLFRYWKKEVIAIFPDLPGTYDPNTCFSYVHYGQHGNCHKSLIRASRPATPAEYHDLKKELEAIGYVF